MLLDFPDSHENQRDLRNEEEKNVEIVQESICANITNVGMEMPDEKKNNKQDTLDLENKEEHLRNNEQFAEVSKTQRQEDLEINNDECLASLDNQKILELPKENENCESQECLFRINKIDIVVDISDNISVNESNHDGTTENLFYRDKTLLELSRYSWGAKKHFYLNGCKWSPDGTCVLASVNEDGMHIIELPRDMYTANDVTTKRPLDVLQSAVYVKNGGTVYDYCWYPFMNSNVPETCW